MSDGAVATVLSALANASRIPVAEDGIRPILATGDGPGHLVRTLFGDCSLETLDRLGAEFGLSRAQVRTAYRRAKTLHAARNPEFDALDDGG